jgi:hypothetical protein
MVIKKKRKSNKAKPYNMGTMTEAKFKSSIINALRQLTMYWKPTVECLKQSQRGVIIDNWVQCDKESNRSLLVKVINRKKTYRYEDNNLIYDKKIKDITWKKSDQIIGKKMRGHECNECKKLYPKKLMKVDHINPIVPVTGFEGYDSWIKRAFVEIESFQALCLFCHQVKSNEENAQRNQNKKENKND